MKSAPTATATCTFRQLRSTWEQLSIAAKTRRLSHSMSFDSSLLVLAWDAAGVVEAVGPDVTLFKPGDEVFSAGDITRQGANSEFHLIDERIVGTKPKSPDFGSRESKGINMPKPLRVCNIDLSFHAASAAVVNQPATQHVIEVETSAAPHEEAFRRLGANEVDILISAWLPASHRKYLDPIASGITKLTVLYEPYCIWGVPDYIPATEIREGGDLLKPGIAAKMDKVIHGINPGGWHQPLLCRHDRGVQARSVGLRV